MVLQEGPPKRSFYVHSRCILNHKQFEKNPSLVWVEGALRNWLIDWHRGSECYAGAISEWQGRPGFSEGQQNGDEWGFQSTMK